MTEDKINIFIAANGQYFPPEKIMFIHQSLVNLDDSKLTTLSFVGYKDPTIALVLSLLLGGWGIDRFYIGDVGLGVLKLLTCGGLGIWAIIDWFMIMGETRNSNYNKLSSYLH